MNQTNKKKEKKVGDSLCVSVLTAAAAAPGAVL